MIVQDILNNRIVPFEIEDERLKTLFSFFLHRAPTIDSHCRGEIPACGQDEIWNSFIEKLGVSTKEYQIYRTSGYITDKNLTTYNLQLTSEVDRRTKRFVSYIKTKDETELECLLRHLRNSVAHGNVFLFVKANRKYLIFDDFNTNNHLTARILLSQTDLMSLKRLLE